MPLSSPLSLSLSLSLSLWTPLLNDIIKFSKLVNEWPDTWSLLLGSAMHHPSTFDHFQTAFVPEAQASWKLSFANFRATSASELCDLRRLKVSPEKPSPVCARVLSPTSRLFTRDFSLTRSMWIFDQSLKAEIYSSRRKTSLVTLVSKLGETLLTLALQT